MMVEVNRAGLNVLNALATSAHDWTPGNFLPNGHGKIVGARGEVLTKLRHAGLIEYGKAPQHSHYGWRLTDAGREWLRDTQKGGEP